MLGCLLVLTASTLSPKVDITFGSLSQVVRELRLSGELPSTSTISPNLTQLPIAIAYHHGNRPELKTLLADLADASWVEKDGVETLRRDPKQYGRLVAEQSNDYRARALSAIDSNLSILPRGFDPADQNQVASLAKQQLQAAKADNWQKLPLLSLDLFSLLILRDALDDVLRLRPGESMIRSNRPSGLITDFPAKERSLASDYLRVSEDAKVRSASREAIDKAGGNFGPLDIDFSLPPVTMITTLSRGPQWVVVISRAYSDLGGLVDIGSRSVGIPVSTTESSTRDLQDLAERTPVVWAEDVLKAQKILKGAHVERNAAVPFVEKIATDDPIAALSKDLVDALVSSGETCVGVVGEDYWLPQLGRLKEDEPTLRTVLDFFGKLNGVRMSRIHGALIVRPEYSAMAEEEQTDRSLLHSYAHGVRADGYESLPRNCELIRPECTIKTRPFVEAFRRLVGAEGWPMMTDTPPPAISRWLGSLSPQQFESIFSSDGALMSELGRSDPVQLTLDSWAPFGPAERVKSTSEIHFRVAAWPPSRFVAGTRLFGTVQRKESSAPGDPQSTQVEETYELRFQVGPDIRIDIPAGAIKR